MSFGLLAGQKECVMNQRTTVAEVLQLAHLLNVSQKRFPAGSVSAWRLAARWQWRSRVCFAG